MPPLPALPRLRALTESGPFGPGRVRQWFTDDGGPLRELDLEGYEPALVEHGVAADRAEALVGRMREHGTEQVLWWHGLGGRRGQLTARWDLRVADTATPATEAVPAVIGNSLADGYREVTSARRDADLVSRPGVLEAIGYRLRPETRVIPDAPRPRWARLLGLKVRVRFDMRASMHAAVAVGHVGATIVTSGRNAAEASASTATLIDLLLADLADAAATAPEPSPPERPG